MAFAAGDLEALLAGEVDEDGVEDADVGEVADEGDVVMKGGAGPVVEEVGLPFIEGAEVAEVFLGAHGGGRGEGGVSEQNVAVSGRVGGAVEHW